MDRPLRWNATLVIAAWLLFWLASSFSRNEDLLFCWEMDRVDASLSPRILSLHPRCCKEFQLDSNSFKERHCFPYPSPIGHSLYLIDFCFVWAVEGWFYFFVKSLYPFPRSHVSFLAGSLSFASLLGLIASCAYRIRVREGILFFPFLSDYELGGRRYLYPMSLDDSHWIGLIGVIYLVSKLESFWKKERDDWTEKERRNGEEDTSFKPAEALRSLGSDMWFGRACWSESHC